MNTAKFRFYEELNDFLPFKRKRVFFDYHFEGNPSVKDIIESIGVPHTEIDLILVNGKSVSFRYNLVNGDNVSVYPVFENLDISGITHLREKPLRDPKFIADVQLGKLARNLRMLGFDTYYDNSFLPKDIIKYSLDGPRTILTRNLFLLKNTDVSHGYWIRSQIPYEQTLQVIHFSDLLKQVNLFSRCRECNGNLIIVEKDEVIDRLKPNTIKYFNEFRSCSGCGRVYWKGSHYGKIQNLVERLKKDAELIYNAEKTFTYTIPEKDNNSSH